jgi:hypothetical protein
MDDIVDRIKDCRQRLLPSLFRIPSNALSKELAVVNNARDGSLSSHMLRVTAEVCPTLEDAVQYACSNLGFPREILDVYVRPGTDNNAFSSRDGGRAKVTFNSYLVETSDRDELAYVVGHEIGHYLFPEANVRQLVPNVEGCMISRCSEFTMDRIGLVACRSVDKAVSAELKSLSGLSNKHLRMDATAIVAQWREATKSSDMASLWMMATHPPTGMRAKALIQFYGSDAYRLAIGQSGGESIEQVNGMIGSELDRLIDNHANQLIADKLNKLSGWLCAFVATRGIKLRLSNLRHGLCTAPEEIIKRCLSVIIEETPVSDRERISNEKLVSILKESCELAPGHTRVYLQSVAEASEEIRPLLQQLDGLSRQQGIMIVPAKN